MKDGLERFGLLAGGLAGVLWVVAVFLDSGAEIVDFYRDNRAAILTAATLHGLGGFLFLWFVASLRAVLGTLAAPAWLTAATVIGGTAGGAMMLGMMGGQSAGATTDVELLSPDTAIVFWRIAHVFFVAAELALALFVGALAILALRRVVLTRWLGWFGLVVHHPAPDPTDRLGRAALPAAALAGRRERRPLAPGVATGRGRDDGLATVRPPPGYARTTTLPGRCRATRWFRLAARPYLLRALF